MVKEEKARGNVKMSGRDTDGQTQRKKQLETLSYHRNHERSGFPITELQKLAITQRRVMAEMGVKREVTENEERHNHIHPSPWGLQHAHIYIQYSQHCSGERV
ncbi:unnamed protein product [Pleuronectes platessa]|uniref:Uncharacterized protein n=1 Tax=Pleuronectes platessa TaxID=8262 RepID=A0A9N7W3A2_PLEPL|nr:unnamed protein product [Pleuronectes platessa]